MRVTLTIGVLMVVTALAVNFVSTYRLAASSARGRQADYLRLVLSEIDSRLDAASLMTRRTGSQISEADTKGVSARLLSSQYVGASELVDRLLVTSRSGKLLAAYPMWRDPAPRVGVELGTRLGVGEEGFAQDVAAADGSPTLWIVERIRLADGTQQLLMARVRTSFMKDVATRISSSAERRAVAIVHDGRILVAGAGGPALLARTAEYDEREGAASGTVGVRASAVGAMRGYWGRIDALGALGWRAVVVEPESAVVDTSLRATMPTAVVLVIGGFIGILMSWLIARRLVRPLRRLETASLEAASGAYVEPLKAERDDEVGRLADAFNAVALRLNSLHDVSVLLAGATSLEQVIDATLRAVEHLLAPADAAVYLLDVSGSLRLAGASGGFAPPEGPFSMRRAGALGPLLGARGAAVLDASGLPGEWGLDDDTARIVASPLMTSTGAVGLILAVRKGPSEFTDAETEMLATFAPQAATAVAKSELFAKETESRRTAEALRDVAAELVRPVGIGDALEATRVLVERTLAGRSAFFAFRDREALGIDGSPGHPLADEAIEIADEAIGVDAMSEVLRRGDNTRCDELLDRLTAGEVLIAKAAPEASYGAVLVVAGGSASFGTQELEIVDGVAKIVTIALDSAYSAERSRMRATNLEKVFRISQAVGSSLQLNVVLNRVLDVVQMIFAADAVSLMIYDADRRVLATSMARGSISAEILHLEVAPGVDLPGQVFARRQPVSIEDLSTSDLGLAIAADRLGLKTLMAVPLLARGAPIGVLNVFARVEGTFDDEDMGLLQTFASQAALAIDTARLYEREHTTARTLQRSILPERPPVFEEIDVATAYEPAGSESDIGGDYFDMFRSPGGSIVAAIADVCGKGVDAATKTSMIKYSIRALTAAGLGPGECLSEINDLVVGKGDPSDILTVWLGFLDPEAGVLRWANGGHPPGLLLRSESRAVERLTTTGPLLGAMQGVTFEESEVLVSSGDSFLLYTDGVTEARSGNKFFGEGRLTRCLRYGGMPESMMRNILDALGRFATTGLRDDVAMLIVRVKPGSGRSPLG